MKIKQVKCKTALSFSSLPGLDYTLNPYRGCQHACAYCYVPNVLRIPRDEWGCFVDVRTNIPSVLSKELKKKKIGVVGISTVTDPYQPIENRYKLTRYCLEQLLIHNFPICVQTKSDLITRDVDLISKFSKAEVMFSIGAINDEERKIVEPYSSSIKSRLEAMKRLNDIGIKTTVFFGPVYPTIKIGDLSDIIETFKQHGATEIMIDKLNLKPGIKKKIIAVFPPYKNLIENTFYYQKLFDEFISICKRKNVKAFSAF